MTTDVTEQKSELKRGTVLVFCEGKLTIKLSGYGAENGWATLSIPEDQIEYDEGHATVEIAPSELRALRDFIDKTLTTAQRQKGE